MSSDSNTPIYTIGYGSRSFEEFIAILKFYEIEFLIDVRSRPYSQYKIEFSRNALEHSMPRQGIRYIFMGDILGGQPDDSTCYTDGKVDYEKCLQKEFHIHGIERLKKARQGNHRVVLMCSEGKPQECHRSKMIGKSLTDKNIPVIHIDEIGELKTQMEIVEMLEGTNPQLDLFVPSKLIFSRKKYRKG